LADQIALLAIYMPLLQEGLPRFVRTWNTHPIRNQSSRSNAVPGKPFMLYHAPGPGVQDHGHPVDQERLRAMKDVQSTDWDMNAYLPIETYSFCQDFFTSIDFHPPTASALEGFDIFNPCFDVYLQLRSALQAHIDTQREPVLSLLQSPVGESFQFDQDSIPLVDLETDQDS
jgi:hypothetical protein